MLVRLPPTVDLDIVEVKLVNNLGVSTGEDELLKSCARGGDSGVSGRGFSFPWL